MILGPPPLLTAASMAVRSREVTRRPRRSTTSRGARSRLRTCTRGRRRPWLLRGTVTSTTFGGVSVRPCHHAAEVPLAAAEHPYDQTAARIHEAVLNG